LCKHVQQCGYSGDCAVSRAHLRPAVDTCPGPAAAEAHVADNEEPRTHSGTRSTPVSLSGRAYPSRRTCQSIRTQA
jgi:hypothetical protein